jgi:putative acetyltransferase
VSAVDSVILRRANPREQGGVRSLNEAAFGRRDEAGLIDRLRAEGAVLASFVAECEKRMVGHILFMRNPAHCDRAFHSNVIANSNPS